MFLIFLNIQFNSIIKNLENFSVNQDPECVHDLRVNIKKLRAVCSFLRKAGQEKLLPKRILGGLFDDAGEMRDLQMNIKLMEQFDQPKQVLETLKVNEEKLAETFVLKIPGYMKEVNRNQNSIIFSNEDPGKKHVKNYFDKMINKCIALLAGPKDPENLHRFRMLIKKLMYVLDALPRNLARPVGLNVKYLERLQKKAGEWHDAYIGWQFLQSLDVFPEELIEKGIKNEKEKYRSMDKLCRNFKQEIYKSK
jgi:CHAD domain-containing protein